MTDSLRGGGGWDVNVSMGRADCLGAGLKCSSSESADFYYVPDTFIYDQSALDCPLSR